jgi:hypothetical protein
MKRKAMNLVVLGWFLCFGLVMSRPSYAQVSGATLSGTVTDSQGAVVPNAKVSVRNAATGRTTETTSNATGLYTVPNLVPGDYDVSVSTAGFSTAMVKLTLTVGQKQELNVPLAVGQLAQTVEVTSLAPQVDLESSTITGTVSATTVRELPLNGRDWTQLATLEPGVEQIRDHALITGPGGAGGRGLGSQLSVSGARPSQNSYRLDGAIVNDYSNNGPGSVLGGVLGVDAVQEFSVMTSNYSAEYGFTSGGVINAITRSGTNAFHGSAFEFRRDSRFDATNFFSNSSGLAKNPLDQNQFGATGGYKVPKINIYLFGAYEGVRKDAGNPITTQVTISDAVRSGSVTNLSTGQVVNVPINPIIQPYLALYPEPSSNPSIACVPVTVAGPLSGKCNPNEGFSPFLGNQHSTENFFTFRADKSLTSKDTMFVTYVRDPSSFSNPKTFNDVTIFDQSFRTAGVIEETHVFSPAWANSVRVAVDRTTALGGYAPAAYSGNPAATNPALSMFGPNVAGQPAPPASFQSPNFYAPAISMTGSGLTAVVGANASSAQSFWGQIFQIYDDAFSTHGNHSIKFGFAFLDYHEFEAFPQVNTNGTGVFAATGLVLAPGAVATPTAAEAGCLKSGKAAGVGANYDPGCGSIVNLLTDNAQQSILAQYNPNIPLLNANEYLYDKAFGGYIQDDWKARSNLTVNLGLRYEMSTIPYDGGKGPNTTDGGGPNGEKLIMPNITTILPCGSIGGVSLPSPLFPAAPCPLPSVAAAGLAEGTGDPGSVERASYWTHNPTLKNFEPRIGLAWDPFHDGKTSVRAGIGLFDVLPLPYALANETGTSGVGRSELVTLGSSSGLYASPPAGTWPYSVPALASAALNVPLARSSWYYVDNNIKRNYVTQWNVNIQRQITKTLTVLVGYNGSRSVHNPMEYDSVNTIQPTLVAGVGDVYPTPWHGSGGPLTSAVANSALLNPSIVTSSGTTEAGTLFQSNGWYEGGQVKVSKIMSRGFQLTGSFTYSKCVDNSSGSTASDTFSLDNSNGPFWDISQVRGLCDFDVRRNLVINGIWNVPTTKALGIVGEKILGGWQVGTIGTVSDGIPFPIQMGQDILGEIISTGPPPELTPGCSEQSLIDPNYHNNLSYIAGFNNSTLAQCMGLVPRTAANAPYCDSSGRGFTAALAASTCANIRGNLGRNVIIGPGLWNVDFSLFKNNYIRKISETANVQFRAEMFNVLNHTNMSPPGGSLLSDTAGDINPSLGKITQTQGQDRIIQFALKLIW